MSDIVARLTEALGPEVVSPAAEVPERFRHDWSGLPPVVPLALVRPRTTDEVETALRLCNAARVGVVPQGGRTGLTGGAHPLAGAVALSLDRMTAVEEVDADMGTMTVQAGVTLQAAQEAAAEAGLLLGIDIGSRGSCTIGGVVSTNGGGTQVIRYGMAREHVLGLEAVLADGTVVTSLNKLLKNNVGLDAKQMFIGTEGLLGVVTRIVLRLMPRPAHVATAFCGVADTAAVIALLGRARQAAGPVLTSFEVMWPSFFDVMSAGSGHGSPLAGRHGAYAILETAAFREGEASETLESCLAEAMEAGLVEDAVLAGSIREQRGLWAVRESVSDYGTIIGANTGFDIGLPLARMDAAVRRLEGEVAARWPGAKALSYGHIGDSNLHFVVHVPTGGAAQPEPELKALVYAAVRDLGGTISAEHGIGVLKRDYMGFSRTEAELGVMRAVKAALDPNGILNPGRSFAPDAGP